MDMMRVNTVTIKDKSHLYDLFLTKAKNVFSDTKKNLKKGIKSFFPPKFKEYPSKDQENVLLNAMQLCNYRNKIIGLFENRNIRPSAYAPHAESYGVEKSKQKFDESIRERVKLKRQKVDAVSEISKQIAEIDKAINKELFRQYFRYQDLIDMQKELYKTRNTERSKVQANLIKSSLEKLENDIKKMPKNEIEIKKSNEIVDLVVQILNFNNQNQEGKGLNILTPQRMLSRLRISLAQLQAGNNSEKLNEIRQLFYSLYR